MRQPSVFDHTGLLVAGAAAFSMSTLFSAMKPVLLTRFVEQTEFGESLAGLIVAMPFVGIAASSLVLKWLLVRLNLRPLFLMFSALLVLTEFSSAFLYDIPNLVLLAQFLGGISVGVLMGATSQVIATSSKPDEIFGFVDMMAVFLMSFMIAGVGASVGRYGLQGGYLFATGISLIFGILMLAYRGKTEVQEVKTHKPLKISSRAVSVVVMGVLFVTSSGMGFAFMFTIARNLSMEYAQAGSFIGALLLISALACQLGGWCSGRFGPLRPLACAFATCGVGWYFAIHATSQITFMIALVPAIFSLQFNFPILLALSGSLDEDGQWAAIATPLLTSGFAWAAISAGIIVNRWNLDALATATILGMLCCLLLTIPAREKTEAVQLAS